MSQLKTPLEKWLAFWPNRFRKYPGKYELVVAHPVDYLELMRGCAPIPEHLLFRWDENVMPGHPAVYENKNNWPGVGF